MTTPSGSDKKPPRRWFSPRFSLKMLMLAVTAAAIGSAVWWRWPITDRWYEDKGAITLTHSGTFHRGLWGTSSSTACIVGLSMEKSTGKCNIEKEN